MPVIPKAKKFRFNAASIHLTYKTHLGHEDVLSFLKSKGDLKWYSIVHETGHTATTDSDSPDQDYDHTHAACEWKKKLDLGSPRCFDIGNIHPHIQKITGNSHACKLYEEYHRKSPVLLTQSETTPRAHAASEEGIKGAMSLFEACKAMDIDIKTVADVMLIRNDKRKRAPYEHSFKDTIWTLPSPDSFRCLYVYGPSGTGKTQWALHLFENPLMVRHVDQLRDFDPATHDGIVFDDMNFNAWTREMIIHLTDWDEESAIQCRYSPGIIPRHTRKVFTSNKTFQDNMLHNTEDYAISRRFTKIIHVTGKTYKDGVQALLPEEDPIMVADANYPQLPYAAPGAWAPNFLPPGEYDEIDKAINQLLVEDPLIDIDTGNIWASLPAYDNLGSLPFNYDNFDLN